MITCIGISCSPRRGGNTSLLLEQALEGVARGGARTELITLSDCSFKPCQGCNACSRDGECILKDDMQQIYQKLLAADRLILAAPIFSMNLNAQAKALIDRSQRFWSTKFILKRPVIPDAAARPKLDRDLPLGLRHCLSGYVRLRRKGCPLLLRHAGDKI